MSLNADERQALTEFLNQLTTAPAPAKLADADNLIREAVAKQPDAAYLLVQRSLLMEQALNAAKAQIAQLESRVQALGANTGQIGGFLGNNPWAAPMSQPASGVPGAGGYQLPQVAAPATGRNWAGSSFLGNVATTAAGVVAGSFLFQGIESLMGHHSAGWGGNPLSGSPQDQVADQTIINNYYEAPRDAGQLASADDGFLASDDGLYDDGNPDDSSWV